MKTLRIAAIAIFFFNCAAMMGCEIGAPMTMAELEAADGFLDTEYEFEESQLQTMEAELSVGYYGQAQAQSQSYCCTETKCLCTGIWSCFTLKYGSDACSGNLWKNTDGGGWCRSSGGGSSDGCPL